MTSRMQLTSVENPREARGRTGMAATSQPLATLVAIHVLNDGGSAVDAAIAANAMLGLVEPTGCGVGGDLFALVWDPVESKVHGLNASGRAPLALPLPELLSLLGDREEIPLLGPHCITVPGCVDGWFELHERFGRLEMAKLLAPAIHAAQSGFPVTPVIAEEWAQDVVRVMQAGDLLVDSSAFSSTYAPRGRTPVSGEKHVNPDLARTLQQISRGGRKEFYSGAIAKTIASSVAHQGGILSTEDLSSHRSEWVDPISTGYRGFDVHELPPNNQGVTVLQMLRLLDAFDLPSDGFGTSDALHLFIEIKKLAFEDRARFISDPAFAVSTVEFLLSEKRLARQRDQIDPSRPLCGNNAFLPVVEAGDTCYLTTADKDGMMVSLIQSNFIKTGSGIVPDGLGFALQNRGALFSLKEGHANAFAPGKRPFHTIIPAFVTLDKQPLLSFGVMGGAMQPQGHVQILTNLIDFGMTLQEAGDAPRWRHVGSSRPTGFELEGAGAVLHEPGFDDRELALLEQKGHVLHERRGAIYFGGYQAIGRDSKTGEYVGASDKRKDGLAMGL